MVLWLSGCGDAEPVSAPVKSAPEVGADGPAPSAQGVQEVQVVEPVGEQWLVWFDAGQGWRTRWVTAATSGPTVTTTAERSAVVIAQGTRLWSIRRRDTTLPVRDCRCLDDESSPECAVRGSVVYPGLQAVPMGDGPPRTLVGPTGAELLGEVDELSLALRGGVGTRLFTATGNSGYYCGAHGLVESTFPIVDPTATEPIVWPEVTLPSILQREAAVGGLLKRFQACEDDPSLTMDRFLSEFMTLSDVEMSLRRGMVRLRWHFTAPVPHACSADYGLHGETASGLLPQAESLGLSGPLSPGLQAALREVGTAEVVGWSQLSVQGEARAAALRWFEGLDESPWPPAVHEQVQVLPNAEVEPEGPAAEARQRLAQGRKLTRDGEYSEAIAALSQALEADPELARAWAARGYARLLSGDLERSVSDSKAALKREGSERFRAAVLFNLGQAEQRRGHRAAARRVYRESVALRPNAEVEAALEGLR